MRYIKVSNSGRALRAIVAVLSQCQAQARARVLTPNDVMALAHRAEVMLSGRGIPKSARVGCRVRLNPAHMPRRYRWPAYSTSITLVRLANGWAVESVQRVFTWPKPHGRPSSVQLLLGEAAKAHLVETCEFRDHIGRLVREAFQAGQAAVQNCRPATGKYEQLTLPLYA